MNPVTFLNIHARKEKVSFRAMYKIMLRRTLVLNSAHKAKVDSKDGFEWTERHKEKIGIRFLLFYRKYWMIQRSRDFEDMSNWNLFGCSENF